MANRTKVQDMQEVERWMAEERPYSWMIEQYRTKYNIETSLSMWAGLRRKLGYERRFVRDDDLIPWAVLPQHSSAHQIAMLRTEARRRAGKQISEKMTHLVDAWIQGMKDRGEVVTYDPDTESGWAYVKPRPNIDTDLIRVPDRKTTHRRARED